MVGFKDMSQLLDVKGFRAFCISVLSVGVAIRDYHARQKLNDQLVAVLAGPPTYSVQRKTIKCLQNFLTMQTVDKNDCYTFFQSLGALYSELLFGGE